MKYFAIVFGFNLSFGCVFGNQLIAENVYGYERVEVANDIEWVPELIVAPFEEKIERMRRFSDLARKGTHYINQGEFDRFESELLPKYKKYIQESFLFQAGLIKYSLLRNNEEVFLFVLDHLDVEGGLKEYSVHEEAIDIWFRSVLSDLMNGMEQFSVGEARENHLLKRAVSLAAEGTEDLDHDKLKLASFFFRMVSLANPENGRALNGLGVIHELAGDLDGALMLYKKADSHGWVDAIRNQFVLFMRHKRYDDVYEILPRVKSVFGQDHDVQMLLFGFSIAVGDRKVFRWAHQNADLEALRESRTAEEYSVIGLGIERFGGFEEDETSDGNR